MTMTLDDSSKPCDIIGDSTQDYMDLGDLGDRLANSDLRALEQETVINYDRHHVLRKKHKKAVGIGKNPAK